MGCSDSKSASTTPNKKPKGKPIKGMMLYTNIFSAPARAVMLTLKELNLNPETKTLDLMKGEQKEEWFLKINPDHTVPTLKDGDFILWESKAIMQYLCNKYAPGSSLYPSDLQQRAIVDKILCYDACVFGSAVGKFVVPQLMKGEAPDPEKEKEMLKSFEYLEKQLTGQQFLASDTKTIADISIFSKFGYLALLDYHPQEVKDKFPLVSAWLSRMFDEEFHGELMAAKEAGEKARQS